MKEYDLWNNLKDTIYERGLHKTLFSVLLGSTKPFQINYILIEMVYLLIILANIGI